MDLVHYIGTDNALNMKTQQTASCQSGTYPGLVPHPVWCCWKKAELVVAPKLLLHLLCQTPRLQLLIHLCLQSTELGNFFCLSHDSHFSLSLTPFPRLFSSSSGFPVRRQHTRSGQNDSSCLYLQLIFPLTGQSKCLSLRESFSFPLNYTA